MKLCKINVECLANMHTNIHYFTLLNNDFTGFVYELLMSTHNICFYEQISKIIPSLARNTHLICSTGIPDIMIQAQAVLNLFC